MNILILDKDGVAHRDLGSKISDLGAVLHLVPNADAMQQMLSNLCKGYGAGCCLVLHQSLDGIVERVNRLKHTPAAADRTSVGTERLTLTRQFQRLSPRESEVLRFVLEGLTSLEIAERLNISLRTVKMHRGNIMAKVRVRNVAELVSLYHTTAAKAA